MLLPRFQYHEPENLEEACEMLAGFKGEASPLAGGTDLIVNMKKGVASPKHVLSLARIKELKSMGVEEGHMKIGACVTIAELAESFDIKQDLVALRAHWAERVLTGQIPGESLFAKAGDAAARDSRPIDDFRGVGSIPAEYGSGAYKEGLEHGI